MVYLAEHESGVGVAAAYVQDHNWQHLAAVDRLNHSMLVFFRRRWDSGE